MFMQLWAKPPIYKGISEVHYMYNNYILLIDCITPYKWFQYYVSQKRQGTATHYYSQIMSFILLFTFTV